MPEIKMQPLDRSALIQIWLDGACTGLATAAMTFGFTDTEADKFADMMVKAMQTDPAAMEQVRKQVLERLQGIDSDPYTFTAHTVIPPQTDPDGSRG